ncbi:large ribosomal subunit protein cL37 alpha-like [Nicotiana sylvestris]
MRLSGRNVFLLIPAKAHFAPMVIQKRNSKAEEMALLFNTPPTTTPSSHASSNSSTFAATSYPFFRFCNDPIALQPKSYVNYYIQAPFILKGRSALIAKAATDIDSAGSDNTESDEESKLVGNLPLESKLQLKLEQKMKMKLAKNIRLRRKKLVRKRRLRKKGRWPPSKLKKNKNV